MAFFVQYCVKAKMRSSISEEKNHYVGTYAFIINTVKIHNKMTVIVFTP